MEEYQVNQRKNMVRSLRKGGYSYTEIQKFVNVPKATLAFWTRDIKLSEEQAIRLRKKQLESVRAGTKKRSENIARRIEQIEVSAVKDIGSISKRELWLMGILLYWRNQNKNDVRKGVSFTSSDPDIVRLFLKWLKDVGQVSREEIAFDLFLGKPVRKKTKKQAEKETLDYWSVESGYPQSSFTNLYYYKKPSKALVRVRVKASSMLARQLDGWIRAIKSLI